MAPGDMMFYLVQYDNAQNKLNSFKTRKLADEAFAKLSASTSAIVISGETGDILAAKGDQNLRD